MPAVVNYESFGTKDPDDVEPKNIDCAGMIARLGGPSIVSVTVVPVGDVALPNGETSCGDGALSITNVAFDDDLKIVSFLWAGGTPGKWYLLRCRITFGPTWQKDQSFMVQIAQH